MKEENMNTISISDIQRNLHKIENFDIVEIVDKKRNQVKGYFLDKKYHDFVEELFQKKENRIAKQLEEFKRISQDIPVLKDKSIDLCKIDEDINSDIF
jgi:DNA-binding transcriptional regulator GbsR (MarR family)